MTGSPPRAIAFDMVETCFSLEPLRPRLERAGPDGRYLEQFFAELLRDAFALDACGVYRPFREVAAGVLATMGLDGNAADDVLDGFTELPAHPDVAPAMERVRSEGAMVIALTNGNAAVTETLLERSGLREKVDRVISIDEIGRWKPARQVYLHAADAAGLEPKDVALVACHGWDCLGAMRAGLRAGYVARKGAISPAMDAPEISGTSLPDVVNGFYATA
ncbi:2-haloacid dehalogenase [Palleronia aestuarii]|uniref:(S)-2-haloacid dehalogenase n=1 Tax=Palleronia aestuarii TaxID=568105 RepID=A0A2W7NK78_9RHOB|nr:haloacid dehalogenase type II [Palleronia aestuarii]PZX18487.1 2-haloacid dehalogenase [Palleronia aestuarii]